jgi:hypothetical protein
MQLLDKLKQFQFRLGMQTIDFSAFLKSNPNSGDLFTITQMILAELQTVKAYYGLHYAITPPAQRYVNKTAADVAQLLQWNIQKMELIHAYRSQ